MAGIANSWIETYTTPQPVPCNVSSIIGTNGSTSSILIWVIIGAFLASVTFEKKNGIQS